jgi:hypothetical protein
MFNDLATDSSDFGIVFQKVDCGSQESFTQAHVAINQANVASRAILVAELNAGATGAIANLVQSDDFYWVLSRNLNGMIIRSAVSKDYFGVCPLDSAECALDRRCNTALLV